jgi:hypothetical protein
MADDLATRQLVNKTTARRALAERFSLEEFKTLCFDLGISFDSLEGEGHEAKARALVELINRLNQADKLARAMENARPGIFSAIERRFKTRPLPGLPTQVCENGERELYTFMVNRLAEIQGQQRLKMIFLLIIIALLLARGF